jgi:hypothetical protein
MAKSKDNGAADGAKGGKDTQAEAVEKVNRWQAAHRVVAALEPGAEASLKDLVTEAEAMVVGSGGGKADPESTEATLWNVLNTASELGVVELETRVHRKAAQ